MTLGRQLAIAVSAIFFLALAGVEAIYLRNAQSHLQRQLESTAQDAATSIGLSLGTLMRGVDPALAQTVVNPAFDRGHYARIEYLSPGGESLVARTLPAQAGDYPGWLVRLLPLHAPTAESLVSAGWRQLGRVRVTAHPRFAYEQLWGTARNTLFYLLVIYASALVVLRLFLRGVLRPLAAVERAALAICAREFVKLRIRPSTRELARVVAAMNVLSQKVNEAIQSETARAERLQAAAYRDEVTGLLNARGFAARFESTYEGEAAPLAGTLAIVELTELSQINRQLGPERCDALLRDLCRDLEGTARASAGFAGRWTGAQLIAVLPHLEAPAAGERLAALRAAAAAKLREHGVEGADRIACGAVVTAGAAHGLPSLARQADEALVEAREAPDGVIVLDQHAPGGFDLSGDAVAQVREALGQQRLRLVGQGAYRMSDHRSLHTEIMARLRDRDGHDIVAARFMPIVAAHGLVDALDRSVVEQVLEAMPADGGVIGVNVSMHSAEQPAFTTWLAARLGKDPAKSRRLVFEMAEHGVVRNEAAAAAFARLVARAGAVFAIDNFGVHRDSLALLQRLRPAYIKLAGAHTPRMAGDAGTRFFVESLVRAARQLEIPVIAQMVEDDETFQALGSIGFSGYQGNLIDLPSPWPRS